MNGKPIEEWERQFIRDNFQSLSDEQMGAKLNRTRSAICVLRIKLKCLRFNTHKPFSGSEVRFITSNFQSMNNQQIATHLGRTNASIGSFLNKKRLRRNIRRKATSGVYIQRQVDKMKQLIALCETTQSPYKLDLYKQELKKLSGL